MPETVAALPPHLSVVSFIKTGWEIFKRRPWFFIGTLFVFWIVSFVLNLFGVIVQGIVDGTATSGLGHLIAQIISYAVTIFVGIGTLSFFIKAHDSPETVTYYDA